MARPVQIHLVLKDWVFEQEGSIQNVIGVVIKDNTAMFDLNSLFKLRDVVSCSELFDCYIVRNAAFNVELPKQFRKFNGPRS